MKYLFCAALLLAGGAQAEQSEVSDNYELLVGCSVAYARKHNSPRLTATEMANAAVASCDEYAAKIREIAYYNIVSMAMAELSARQQRELADEIEEEAIARSISIRSAAIERARNAILQFIAESIAESE